MSVSLFDTNTYYTSTTQGSDYKRAIESSTTENDTYINNGVTSASTANQGIDQNTAVTNIFRNTKGFKDITRYRLMRGVPDFGSLVQFNPYMTGYAAFIVCQVPKFIRLLAARDAYYKSLLDNWIHLIEFEFKSFEGLEPMSAENTQLGDDLNNINIITKVNMQSASEFSLTYDERSGSIFTKFNRLFLSGIRDPRTQVRSYHGLIHSNQIDPGFENECFTFLFINTDDTMREVEQAVLIVAGQLNNADTDIYNFTKGDIGKKDITVKFNGYPIYNNAFVDLVARDMMTFLLSKEAGARQIIINSNNYNYTGLETAAKTLSNYGARNASDANSRYPSLKMLDPTDGYDVSNYYSVSNSAWDGTN